MLELAGVILDLTGSRSQIVHRPLPKDDPPQIRPDITKAQALLDWQPTVALRDGLVKTIAYFETLLAREVQNPTSTLFSSLLRPSTV